MLTLNGIQNIIFDLGGVLLNIDYTITEKAFIDLGVENFPELFTQAYQSQLFDKFEMGLISPDDFRDRLRVLANINFSDKQIDHAWNAMLLDMPENRIEILETLRDYNLFLLSNTNEIHLPVFRRYLEKTGLQDRFNKVFIKQYYSSEVGKRKPDPNVFEHVCQDARIDPAETLFIDDTIRHVEGARSFGLNTYFLDTDKESLETIFS